MSDESVCRHLSIKSLCEKCIKADIARVDDGDDIEPAAMTESVSDVKTGVMATEWGPMPFMSIGPFGIEEPAASPAPEPDVTHCPCGVPCVLHSSDGSVPSGGKCSICPTDAACKGGRVTDAELMVVGSIQYVTSLLPGQALGLLKRMAAELRALRALVSSGHGGDAAEHLKAAREALEASPGESICGAARRAQSSLASLRAPVDVEAELAPAAAAIRLAFRAAERGTGCLWTPQLDDWTQLSERERAAWLVAVRPRVERAAMLAREAMGLREELADSARECAELRQHTGIQDAHETLTAAGVSLGDLGERVDDVIEERDAARAEVERLKADNETLAAENVRGAIDARGEIERLRSVLRAVEWSGVPDGGDPDDMPGGCPSCGASETDGKHVPHCALAARLGNEPAPMSALAVEVERLKAELAEAVEGLETNHDEQQAAAELNARLAADAKNEIERLTKERDAALAGEKYLSKVVGKLTKVRDEIASQNVALQRLAEARGRRLELGELEIDGEAEREAIEKLRTLGIVLEGGVADAVARLRQIEKAAQSVADGAEWAEEDGPTAKRPACLVDGQLLDALDEALAGKR